MTIPLDCYFAAISNSDGSPINEADVGLLPPEWNAEWVDNGCCNITIPEIFNLADLNYLQFSITTSNGTFVVNIEVE